jgi:transposase-like protein
MAGSASCAVLPRTVSGRLAGEYPGGGELRSKNRYSALAIRADGQKKLLGLWTEQNEGAKFRLGVMNELLAAAGLKKIYPAPSDGLASEALEEFASLWDGKRPMISKSRKTRWNGLIPFFKFSGGKQPVFSF